jgi:hypothetical protein
MTQITITLDREVAQVIFDSLRAQEVNVTQRYLEISDSALAAHALDLIHRLRDAHHQLGNQLGA